MSRIFIILLTFIINSCAQIDFVYEDEKNLINPLYEKVIVNVTGLELVYINSYVPVFFGNNKNHHFDLLVNIEEKKTKKSVESNQAASNLMYELRFFYKLVSKKENCVTFEKKILSSFSIIPKSAGYDYGTDFSIDKKYELAINDNFNQFISSLRAVDINSCQ